MTAMICEVGITFLSSANSAISACLLLPRMLSDFLKAYKYTSSAVSLKTYMEMGLQLSTGSLLLGPILAFRCAMTLVSTSYPE